MVRIRSIATSPGQEESGNASSHPNCNRQSALVMPPPSMQHIQSRATAMAKLTRQNQELTREIGRRQHQGGHTEGQAQSQEVGGENVEPENQSRGTASRRVLHLEKEIEQMRRVMDEMRENMRRVNPMDDLVHRTDSPFMSSINSHPLAQDAFLGLI